MNSIACAKFVGSVDKSCLSLWPSAPCPLVAHVESDLFDSSSEDDGPATRRNVFPFYVFLTSFLRGLFNPEVDRNSLAVLQQRLQRDPRVRGLPPWMHDLIFHFAFCPFEIRTQVRGFMSMLMSRPCSDLALRRWQAWLRMQCWYDPPTYCAGTYFAIYILEI